MSMFFRESRCISSEEGYSEVIHLTMKGSNYDIGRKLGEIAVKRHQYTPYTVDPVITRCQNRYIERNYPIHFERMGGFAAAYGSDLNDTAGYFSLFGRTLEKSGCSAVYYPPGKTEKGTGILSRNLDFALESGGFSTIYIMEIYPEKGYSSIGLVSFDLFGHSLEGINSEGLTVVHLADGETAETYPQGAAGTPGVGLNEFLQVQLLLDTCATVDEAKEALLINKHHYIRVPVHLLIADKTGRSFVWEYSSFHNKEYIIDGDGSPQIITNFLLHKYGMIDQLPVHSIEKSCAFNRYRSLYDGISRTNPPYSLKFIKENSSRVNFDDSFYTTVPDNPARTLVHSLYYPEERSVSFSFYKKEGPAPESPQIRSEFFAFKLE